MSTKFKLPTETVVLPSKGLLYPEDSPLSKGELEMKYMTAKEEDILTNQNYIQSGIVIDKLLESLIVTQGAKYNDLLIGDKNAVMIAARILSYGKDYPIKYRGEEIIVDLSELNHKEIDFELLKDRKNQFSYTLPNSGVPVTFKILNHSDEKGIEAEEAGLQKINKNNSASVTTRLKSMLTSVNGSKESKDIREFVDNYLLATDARALRDEYGKVSPDINFKVKTGVGEEEIDLPIGIGFFWPEL